MEEFPQNLFAVFNPKSKKITVKRQDLNLNLKLNEEKIDNLGDEIKKKIKVENGKYVFHQVYVKYHGN